MNRDTAALRHILSAIAAIERHPAESEEDLATDELLQSHYVRWLSVIGEASTRISGPLRARHPDVPWREMVGMRNILVHDYEKLDVGEIWRTVRRDLPVLRQRIEAVLSAQEAE